MTNAIKIVAKEGAEELRSGSFQPEIQDDGEVVLAVHRDVAKILAEYGIDTVQALIGVFSTPSGDLIANLFDRWENADLQTAMAEVKRCVADLIPAEQLNPDPVEPKEMGCLI